MELSWPQARTIAQVQLTFPGNTLREYHAYPPFYRDPQCARDYDVLAWVDDTWQPVARTTGNYRTRVVHTLSRPVSTTRLRLVVRATNGDPSAGLYEIRCYARPVCTEPA